MKLSRRKLISLGYVEIPQGINYAYQEKLRALKRSGVKDAHRAAKDSFSSLYGMRESSGAIGRFVPRAVADTYDAVHKLLKFDARFSESNPCALSAAACSLQNAEFADALKTVYALGGKTAVLTFVLENKRDYDASRAG